MDKICKKCGNKINEKDKFCSKCGCPVDDSTEVKNDLENDLSNKTQKFTEQAKILKEKGSVLAENIKETGKNLSDDMKNYKNLSTGKKKRLLFSGIAIVILVLAIIFIAKGCNNGTKLSKEELTKLALEEVQSSYDYYDYKVSLKSCDIVETRSTRRKKWLLAKDRKKVTIYGILLKADVNDSDGSLVESVKYIVYIEKFKDTTPSVHAANYSNKSDDEIIPIIKESVNEDTIID